MEKTSTPPSYAIPRIILSSSIENIPVEIFLIIIQIVVDEEGAQLLDNFPSYSPNLATSVRLALVNKRWKDAIYSFPALWSIISLNLREPLDRVQVRCDRLALFAINWPVDLYIRDLNSRDNGDLMGRCDREPRGCLSRDGQLLLSLQSIADLRSLSIELQSFDVVSRIVTGILPRVSGLKRLQCFFQDQGGTGTQPDFGPLLSKMKRLIDFTFTEFSLITMPNPNPPLLASLRTANLGSSAYVPVKKLLLFLSHTKCIENLAISFTTVNVPGTQGYSTVTLPRLKKLRVKGTGCLRNTFADSWINTPHLKEYDNGGRIDPFFGEWRRFFANNPTVKKLTVDIWDGTPIQMRLYEASDIEDLTLNVSQRSDYKWLYLFTNTIRSPSGLSEWSVCPNLRSMTLRTEGFVQFDLANFNKFVRARCIPTGKEGRTSFGLNALDSFTLWVKYPARVLATVKKSQFWKEAEVEQIGSHEFHLRWKLQHALSSCT